MLRRLCYESEMAKRIPLVKEKNAAVQVALLRDIDEPDLVLIFCTPGAADILNRTYCYVTGAPVQGFGGNGGCPFLLQYPFVTKKRLFLAAMLPGENISGLLMKSLP